MSDGHRVWGIARTMYAAYCAWAIENENTAHPRWFALREDIKEKFLSLAEVLVLEERSEDDPFLKTEKSRAP